MCAHEQTAFTILDEVIKATNRRVNAIEHVVIPRLENTVSYINSELDEMDRWVAMAPLCRLRVAPLEVDADTNPFLTPAGKSSSD
jgi:H(+)-transporting ATP synthase subunit D